MHESTVHNEAGKRAGPLFNGSASPHFYEVILG